MISTMRRYAVAAAIAASMIAGPAVAADGRNFTVNNTNGEVSVDRVWTALAGHDNDPWHPVTMKYSIQPNTSSNFTFPTGADCLFDIKIQFSDDVVQTFSNVNVCRGQTINAT